MALMDGDCTTNGIDYLLEELEAIAAMRGQNDISTRNS